MKKYAALIVILLLSSLCFEVQAPAATKEAMEEISERARRRQYPGGIDEEDIKVQDGLPLANRKIYPRSVQHEVFESLFNQEAEGESAEE